MKTNIICGIIVLLVLGLTFSMLGFYTQSNIIILTQGERYIGYKIEKSFKFPWQSELTYDSINLTSNGSTIFPPSNYIILNTIDFTDQNPLVQKATKVAKSAICYDEAAEVELEKLLDDFSQRQIDRIKNSDNRRIQNAINTSPDLGKGTTIIIQPSESTP